MRKRLLKWGLFLVVATVIVVAALTLHDLPSPERPDASADVTILDHEGRRIAAYGGEDSGPGGGGATINDLPPHLINAVIAIEDRRFYYHFGVDPLGIARALLANLVSGRVVEGGSTITQQLAKNLYLGPERTMKRKLQELTLALILEARFSKSEILEFYLNRVYFGDGAWGVEAAAARYFGKRASALSLRESAMLAGLLKAPSRYDPTRNPEGAAKRMKLVLRAMVQSGYLDEAEARATAPAPRLTAARSRNQGLRYATDWARDRVAAIVGAARGRLIVHTTIDGDLQGRVADILHRHIKEEGGKARVGQGAVVVLTTDGAVKAMVGGADYGKSQYNRAVRALRQPASAFKPFVYLAALEAGWRPDDMIDDSPIAVGDWRPENYRDRYLGRISLTEALARSANAATVRLSENIGRSKVLATARRLGINAPLPNHPSATLGVTEVSVLEMARAYTPFGNGGLAVHPHVILKIEDHRGRLLFARAGSGAGRATGHREAAEMAQMLRAVIETGTGKAARLDRQAGGKTGTSQKHRDAWFVGVTADRAAAVWLGNDDNSPMKNVWGSGMPARIWREVMLAAHRGLPPRALPLPATAPASASASAARRGAEGADGREGLWRRIRRFLDEEASTGAATDLRTGIDR